jgi:hypothetical protein
MDDGYIVGPKNAIFAVLAKFAEGVKRDIGCQLVPEKCKFYNPDSTIWEDINNRDLLPEDLKHMQEGIFINSTGDMLRGLHVSNVPVRDPDCVAAVLRTKANQVGKTTKNYVTDLTDEHRQELWTMMQCSLQHKFTY